MVLTRFVQFSLGYVFPVSLSRGFLRQEESCRREFGQALVFDIDLFEPQTKYGIV